MAKITTPLSEMIKCIAREVKIREAVYPKRVADGKMTEAQSAKELTTIRDVLAYLLEQKAKQEAGSDG